MDTFIDIDQFDPYDRDLWILVMMMKKQRNDGVGKSNAKVYMLRRRQSDICRCCGTGEAKETLTEMVDFLHHPERYTEIGAKLPKGALL